MKIQSKMNPKKAATPEGKRVCCSLLEKVKPDIENYTQELIKAQDDFSKMRWAWGIITLQGKLQRLKLAKKGNLFFVQNVNCI